VVGNKQRTVRRDRHSHGPAVHVALGRVRYQPRQEWLGIARRLAILKWNKHDLIPCARRAVPRAMLGQKYSSLVAGRKLLAGIKRKLQRRAVSTEEHVGNNSLCDQFGLLRVHARIHIVADVAVGPTIEAAVFHRRKIVWWQIVAESVALVDTGPELPSRGCQREARGIAQAGGVQPRVLSV